MVTWDSARLRIGTCWIFSMAAHAIILFSASLWITDTWLTPTVPVEITPSLDVKLTLPAEKTQTPRAINYPYGQITASKNPTRHRTLSDTQFEPRDADYLNSWRHYIESVGTENYKTALKKNPTMKGKLTMRVTIDASGTLKNVVIEKSSGSPALDQLALRIVKTAAPFQPLPNAMKKDTDTLDILRTWQFD